MFRQNRLKEEIGNLVYKAAGIEKEEVIKRLEVPPEGIDADFAFPCFVLAKTFRKDPKTIAEELRKKIRPKGVIREIKAVNGYLNFYLDWKRVSELVLKTILKEKENYGRGKKDKFILLEHTSANPDGPLHIGHFRNTVIGDSLARILSFVGYKVTTDFFCNDTGRQIGIAVMEYMRNPKKINKKPDWWVLDLYVKGTKRLEKQPELEKELQKIMKEFELGNSKIRNLYLLLTTECLKGHKQTFKKIGVKIDGYTKESKYFSEKIIQSLLERIKRLPECRVDGKRIWLDLKKFGISREFTLTRSDGTTLYPLRDLAYHQEKFERADMNINVIGTDQKFYFRQLISALQLLFPEKVKNYRIIFYEFLLLPEGSMSTRKGKFISVDELLEKSILQARKIVEKKMPEYSETRKKRISKAVGIGGLKYAMLKVSPEKTYSFQIEDILKFEGNTAPYLQYTYARACSILRKSGIKRFICEGKVLENPKEIALIKKLMEFPEIVEKASQDLRPHYIANYGYELANRFNEFYQNIPVLNPKNGKNIKKLRNTRLALVKATTIVLKSVLNLLGIEALERM